MHGPLGADVELVLVHCRHQRSDAQRLHLSEVAVEGQVVVADEVYVDVEVGAGDDAEVLVLLVMVLLEARAAAHTLVELHESTCEA